MGENSRKIIFVAIAIVLIGILAIGGYYLTRKDNNAPALPSPSFSIDSDYDAMPDNVEKAIGTDPGKIDTDGDTFADLDEIKSGYSPTIAGSSGKLSYEDLLALKDKIRVADEGFYVKEFESADRHANWKKYYSDDFWFSIEYPKDWIFNYPQDRMHYMEFKKSETSPELISLTYYENEDEFKSINNISLEEYYNKAPLVEKKGIVFFGKEKFQKLIIHDCPKIGSNCTKYFFLNNGHIYQFLEEVESSVLDEILSTFKIVE